MKYSVNLFIIVIALFSIVSCDLFEDTEPKFYQENTAIIGEIPPEIKEQIVAQDSLMKDLVYKIDTLSNALNNTKSEITELKTKIESFQSPKNKWGWMSIGAMTIAIISLLITILKTRGVKKEETYEIFSDCIDRSQRIKELKENIKLLIEKANKISSTAIPTDAMEARIQKLENSIVQIKALLYSNKNISQQSNSTNFSPANSSRGDNCLKVGYAKVDTDMYFTTIYDSNQEGCVFKITFTNQTRGKYTIISLDKIQSRNDWQKKIECSGVSIKEASEFRVDQEGICEKIEPNTWIVTNPLKIRLLK